MKQPVPWLVALVGSALAALAWGTRPVPADRFRPIYPGIALDRSARAVRIRARVVLREGPLELLVCRTGTKEHESILATDVSPRLLAAALIMAGGVPGKPYRYEPFRPPTGTAVSIRLAWRRGTRPVEVSARSWVRYMRTRKPLDRDWVFVGSRVETIQETGEKRFLADDGDLVTLANFYAPLLDLPLQSTASDEALLFEANTKAIPPIGTMATVTFRLRVPASRPSTRPSSRPPRARPPRAR